MKPLKLLRTLTLAIIALASQADASVVIAGTRVIFPSSEREVTIQLTNDSKRPALVQAWLDDGNSSALPENVDVPFTLTPSVFRMESGNGQTLRLVHTGEPLPADRESLFWLNVLEVPPKASAENNRNRIQLAVRSRIKIMYRPDGLAGSADDAPMQLDWRVVRTDGGYALEASNPTPFVVNLGSVLLNAAGRKHDAGMGYVLPRSTQRFPIKQLAGAPAAGATVEFGSINDWGRSVDVKRPVSIAP
ncbi:fimbrial biogenesis chaperone [Burkholderia cenocepacia]|uniref:Pilus assembly protein n=1 Tax=Burkholderia cenocepacia TaxID=95486 RepID=A0A1V2VTZ9_9BURK|nr:fimbria/pilus periplasmic chaperone [Burkholderia cenocepacia]MBR8245572.1 fimbria/pilus periplasmic chaperone [Burkholderia cenocepacia]MBR8266435.1 fimbria/pilus periplasmic chaperone [Burkholderia cenocepacia]MBR8287194.1 fimbria/pilus periplasmic chaperone [Burkholderia cenocepacia]MBR8497932.1 fimbria/pilus periplasmic chaperone [Burkholderia cenocepacia]ONJ02926.1 pilus assembly protein [Burkholderia cenocepacia]